MGGFHFCGDFKSPICDKGGGVVLLLTHISQGGSKFSQKRVTRQTLSLSRGHILTLWRPSVSVGHPSEKSVHKGRRIGLTDPNNNPQQIRTDRESEAF